MFATKPLIIILKLCNFIDCNDKMMDLEMDWRCEIELWKTRQH